MRLGGLNRIQGVGKAIAGERHIPPAVRKLAESHDGQLRRGREWRHRRAIDRDGEVFSVLDPVKDVAGVIDRIPIGQCVVHGVTPDAD